MPPATDNSWSRHSSRAAPYRLGSSHDLSPVGQHRESATTCISGAVLAQLASLMHNDEFADAAVRAAGSVVSNTIERLEFDDFELFYSCARKALNPIDLWSGIRPQNTLSLQWACDFMLALQRITGEREYLEYGEYLLGILALYQQVCGPRVLYRRVPVLRILQPEHLHGEWNDGLPVPLRLHLRRLLPGHRQPALPGTRRGRLPRRLRAGGHGGEPRQRHATACGRTTATSSSTAPARTARSRFRATPRSASTTGSTTIRPGCVPPASRG